MLVLTVPLYLLILETTRGKRILYTLISLVIEFSDRIIMASENNKRYDKNPKD